MKQALKNLSLFTRIHMINFLRRFFHLSSANYQILKYKNIWIKKVIYTLLFAIALMACEKENNNPNNGSGESEEFPLTENELAQYLPESVDGYPVKMDVVMGVLRASDEDTATYVQRTYHELEYELDAVSIEIKDYNAYSFGLQGEIAMTENWDKIPGNVLNEIEIKGYPGYELNPESSQVTIRLVVADRFFITATCEDHTAEVEEVEVIRSVLNDMNLEGLSKHSI
jgi:hypothetical protein